MSLILNIDTATETAHVSIAKDGIGLRDQFNMDQYSHASFVQPAIKNILKDAGINISNIDAIAVTAGPGSYTGIRVGMASAKGLCYALNKPLITLSTLECMSKAVALQQKEDNKILFCPMIDARRMEAYTAIYDSSLNIILSPCALIINEDSFYEYLNNYKMVFFGSGSIKWKNICTHPGATFIEAPNNSLAMSQLSFKNYSANMHVFTDVAYAEPFYIKEFYTKNG